MPYPENPPVAHTGGFGEPTCHACHFDGALNDAAGALTVEGWRGAFVPDSSYTMRVVLHRPGMRRAGFQLSMRTEAGEQAGQFTATNPNTAVDEAGGIQYIRHTPEGTLDIRGDTAVWSFEWASPEAPLPIYIHVSANAGNGDASEFGDATYQSELVVDTR